MSVTFVCKYGYHLSTFEKKMLNPLELELEKVVSSYVDAGNKTWASMRRASAPNC